jgi:hypothetical protein
MGTYLGVLRTVSLILLAGCNVQPLEAQLPPPPKQKTMNMNQPTKPSDTGGPQLPVVKGRLAVARDAESPPTTDYFPTPKQGRWHYDVEVSRPGKAAQKLSAVKYLKDSRQIGGKEYLRMVTEIVDGTLPVPDQFYRVENRNVYAAVQGTEGKELLVLPANPDEQNTWSGDALPSIRRLSGSATLRQRFQHRSHEFGDCVKVSLTMTIVERSFLGGESEVPVRLDRWFAPGVGMVRELRVVDEEGKSNHMVTDSKLTEFTLRENP